MMGNVPDRTSLKDVLAKAMMSLVESARTGVSLETAMAVQNVTYADIGRTLFGPDFSDVPENAVENSMKSMLSGRGKKLFVHKRFYGSGEEIALFQNEVYISSHEPCEFWLEPVESDAGPGYEAYLIRADSAHEATTTLYFETPQEDVSPFFAVGPDRIETPDDLRRYDTLVTEFIQSPGPDAGFLEVLCEMYQEEA